MYRSIYYIKSQKPNKIYLKKEKFYDTNTSLCYVYTRCPHKVHKTEAFGYATVPVSVTFSLDRQNRVLETMNGRIDLLPECVLSAKATWMIKYKHFYGLLFSITVLEWSCEM